MQTLRPAALGLLAAAAVALVSAAPARAAASFTFAPAAPQTGDTVTFDAGGSCGAGGVACRWDLDGDGGFGNDADELDSPQVTHVFATPGPHVVRLVADSPFPGSATRSELTVDVADRPPVAAIRAPATGVVGARIELVSLARDPDDGLASESWDLNGDGVFGDAQGPVAFRRFPTRGRKTVGLRVTDTFGRVSDAKAFIQVGAAPPSPLSPFPVVRAQGQLLPGGIRLERLTVTAPRSATIAAACRPACGADLRQRGTGRAVRLRRFERVLGTGARLEIRVTAPGRIGKYVSFRVVGGSRGYVRDDACLTPGRTRPVECGR